MKRKGVGSKRKANVNPYVTVRVKVSTRGLAIARAIAAAETAEFPEERPMTVEEVLAGALDEGLIQAEKDQLGTRSLDHSVRRWESEDDYPKTTPAMLALVNAVAAKKTVWS